MSKNITEILEYKNELFNTEDRIKNPFFYSKDRYTNDFITGYSQAILAMRTALSHIQLQNDTEELQELYVYSIYLIEKLNETFNIK